MKQTSKRPLTQPIDWYIPPLQMSSVQLQKQSVDELIPPKGFQSFIDSIWHARAALYSPIPMDFLLKYVDSPKYLSQRPEWILRDGLVPLAWFFKQNPTPPKTLRTKLYIEESLAPLIPKAWKPLVGSFRLRSISTKPNPSRETSLFLTGIMNPSHCSLSFLSHSLKKIHRLLKEKKVTPSSVYCYLPLAFESVHYTSAFEFHPHFIKILKSEFQIPILFLGEKEFFNKSQISHGFIYELNEGGLFNNSYLLHRSLFNGLSLLENPPSSSNLFKTVYFSPYHALELSNKISQSQDPIEKPLPHPFETDTFIETLENNYKTLPWSVEFHRWVMSLKKTNVNPITQDYLECPPSKKVELENLRNLFPSSFKKYNSPIPLCFTPFLDPLQKNLPLAKEWIIRDGLIPLLWFFYQNPTPPKGNRSLLYIQKKLAPFVPKAWSTCVGTYEVDNSPDKQQPQTPQTLTVVSEINQGFFSIDEAKEFHELVKKNHSSLLKKEKTIRFISHLSYDPRADAVTKDFQQTTINTLYDWFGSSIHFLSHQDYTNEQTLSNSHLFEINRQAFCADSFLTHLTLSKGASLQSLSTSSKTKRSSKVAYHLISSNHGFYLIDPPLSYQPAKPIEDFFKEIKSLSIEKYSKGPELQAPTHLKLPWPIWFHRLVWKNFFESL